MFSGQCSCADPSVTTSRCFARFVQLTFRLPMAVSLPQRVPQNAPGDFYVEAGLCTRCCLVHGEAPELLNDPDQPFEECYFKRQPRTPAEIEQAINAMCVSEMCALRYAGDDEAIIGELRNREQAYLCDQAPESVAWTERTENWPVDANDSQSSSKRSWWSRLFGSR